MDKGYYNWKAVSIHYQSGKTGGNQTEQNSKLIINKNLKTQVYNMHA